MKNFNFGSDGGALNFSSNISPTIGYTDGVPYITPSEKPHINDEKILGYTYGYMANRGDYCKPQGIRSQDLMYELGNNWVCLAIANYQKTFYSTDIYADYTRTPSDRDIESFCERAHKKGIKVCLKPMLNSDDNMWRAHIGFPDLNMDDMDVYWKKWFISYKAYMLHYAELAEELHCEMLCIGCEMLGTEHRKYDWEFLIDEIRKVYSGKLVYNTNHDHEDSVEWFDKLDYIGTSAYYPVGVNGIDKESMKNEWRKIKERLNKLSDKKKKKYIFMEVGCRSMVGNSIEPWDFTATRGWSEGEQANFYESLIETFMDDDHFAGVFWWDWSTFIYDTRTEAEKDCGFNIHLKKAEDIVKKYYRKYR